MGLQLNQLWREAHASICHKEAEALNLKILLNHVLDMYLSLLKPCIGVSIAASDIYRCLGRGKFYRGESKISKNFVHSRVLLSALIRWKKLL